MTPTQPGRWQAWWQGPVHPVRVFLLQRGLWILIGFDLWLTRLGRAARFGSDSFQVAHFRWMDAVATTPSIERYVGSVSMTGLLLVAWGLAGAPHRGVSAMLALVYTWTWAHSMLDSYQHHYLGSLLLLALALLPPQSITHATSTPTAPRVVATGFPALSVALAAVYGWAGWSKSTAEWRDGSALRRITGGSETTGGTLDFAFSRWISWGAEPATFWTWAGHGVSYGQYALAALYLVAPFVDRKPPRWFHAVSVAAMVAALTFHATTEAMDLKMGWFAWYMIGISVVYWAPAPLLDLVWRPVTAIREALPPWLGDAGKAPKASIVVAALALIGSVVWGMQQVDVPGLGWGVAIACGVLLVQAAWALRSAASGRAVLLLVAGATATASLTSQTKASEVHFDFWRYYANDLRRQDRLEETLVALRKADRYAPAGQNRLRQIQDIETQLRQRGVDPSEVR